MHNSLLYNESWIRFSDFQKYVLYWFSNSLHCIPLNGLQHIKFGRHAVGVTWGPLKYFCVHIWDYRNMKKWLFFREWTPNCYERFQSTCIWRADFQNLLHPLLQVTHLQILSQQRSQFSIQNLLQMENVDTNWNLE